MLWVLVPNSCVIQKKDILSSNRALMMSFRLSNVSYLNLDQGEWVFGLMIVVWHYAWQLQSFTTKENLIRNKLDTYSFSGF